jgi:L-threonylcarbamoyladenylate synthase
VHRRALEEALGERLALADHLLEREAAPHAEPGRPSSPAPRAPGGLPRHYAPNTPAELVAPNVLEARRRELGARVAVLARRPAPTGADPWWLELPGDPTAYGRGLYAALRRLDASGCSHILIEAVPEGDDWLAVRDRLRRAAGGGTAERAGRRTEDGA